MVVAVVTLSVLAACSGTANSLSARTAGGSEAYVAAFGDAAQPGTEVPRVNLARHRADPPLMTTLSEPSALAAVPGTSDLVVVGAGNDQLVEIDAATGRIHVRVTVGLQPDAVAVTTSGTAIVVDGGAGTVVPVNLRTGRAGSPVRVGVSPDAVAIGGPHHSLAVVADAGQGVILPLFLQGMRPGFPIEVGSEPDAIAFTPNGQTALVANLGSDNVTPVDLTHGHPGAAIPVGVAPTGIAVTDLPAPGTTRSTDPVGTAWVSGGDAVVPIDLATMTAGTPIPVGHPAEALALTAGGTRAWVADQSNKITEVDLATGHVGPSVFVGGRPRAIVVPNG